MSFAFPERLDMGRIESLLRTCENPPFKVFLVSPPVARETRIMKTLEAMSRNVPVTPLLYLGAVLEKAKRKVWISEADTFLELKEEIKEFSPHMVGITATTTQMPQAVKTAELVKKINPETIVVGGGPHMSFMYEETLNNSVFDIIVMGAGENPLLQLTERNARLHEIKGIAFRTNEVIMVNPPEYLTQEEYNNFPAPAYHLLKDPARYKESILMISSRGCPFACRMCASSHIWGKKWIAQDAETMIDHLKEVLNQLKGVSDIVFRYYDDMFTLDKKRIKKFVKLLKENKITIDFKCESRVDTFDEEIASYLKEAGCKEVFFGIESGTQKHLDYIDKRVTLEQVEKAVATAHEYGLRVCGSFMIGYPGETEEEVLQTIHFAKKLQVDRMQISILTPFPGTALYREAQEKGWCTCNDWEKYDGTYPVMKLENGLDKKLLHLLKKGYISFYLDPRYWYRQVRTGYLIREGYGKTILKTLVKYIAS